MIKNIPTYKEFEKLGLECTTKAFEMLYTLGNEYNEISKDEVIKEEVSSEDYWKHNDITVRTSLIVLFQGIEYLMKMKITEKSALLLIENNRSDWPTLPKKKDKNFDELITISGENLLGVFCAISNENFNLTDFVTRYEKLRINRNKLVHSTGVKDLDYKYIIKETLYFLSVFYTKTKWIELFREMFISEPTFGYWDSDVEQAEFYQILNFIEDSLSKGEINKYLPYDIKSRRYLCPECTYWLNKHGFDEENPRWSFLKPNTAESKIINCLICNTDYDIERENCKTEDCNGNVLCSKNYENQCLTCFSE
ncbi:hypothetical protein [Tenacibaculum maritimum]|uniref:hypothetical protein n=1 Tax=Tenacibaculum maritimum TaxID=107401 RepID=UPI00132FE95A|nr:hypothetical protein [Tenacibaculum maritimum]